MAYTKNKLLRDYRACRVSLEDTFTLLRVAIPLSKSQRETVEALIQKHYDAIFELEQQTIKLLGKVK